MKKIDYFEYDGNISENKVTFEMLKEDIKNRLFNAKRGTSSSQDNSTIKSLSHLGGEKINSAIHTIVEKSENSELTTAKKVRMIGCFVLAVVIFFSGFVGFSIASINHKNKKLEEYKTNASKVCVDYVTQYGNANSERLYTDYKISGYRLTGLCFVRELDFDDDGDIELMLCYLSNANYYVEVWGYNDNEQFEMLYNQKSAKTGKRGEICWTGLYYDNKKYSIPVHDENDATKVKLYRFKNNKFEADKDCTYDVKEQTYSTGDKDDDGKFELIQLSKLEEKDAVRAIDRTARNLEEITGSATFVIDPNAPKTLNEAYYSVIQEYHKKYGEAKYAKKNNTGYIEGLAVVDLIDFDGDGQNELLLCYRKKVVKRDEDEEGNLVSRASNGYSLEIFRYKDNKALRVYKNEGISNNSEDSKDSFFVLKKSGKRIDYVINSHITRDYGSEQVYSSTAFKLKKNELKAYSRISKEKNYGYYDYFIDGDEISRSRYDEYCDGIPYFNGNTTYDKDKYTVEFVQRKLINSNELNERINKTVENIKKINSKYVPTVE